MQRTVAGAAGVVLTGLAGCSEEGEPEGLVAVSATTIHRPGIEGIDYPADMAVRVAVENYSRDRRRGTLRATLDREATADSAADSWSSQREFRLQGLVTRNYRFAFPDVVTGDEPESAFRAQARVLDQEPV